VSTFALYGFDFGNGAVDVQIGKHSNDLGAGWGDSYNLMPGSSGFSAVNMRADTMSFAPGSAYLGYDDGRSEYAFASESLYAVGWDLNSLSTPLPADDTKIKVAVIPRNEDQILAEATASLMTNEDREIKAVIVAEDGTGKFGIGGARFRSALGPASASKLSDSGSSTLVNSIVQRISSSELAAKKTAVAKKTAGAAYGSISRTFALDPQKTYYYEYEASGGDAKDAVNFSASTVSARPETSANNLYVQKTYFNDFGEGVVSDFFGTRAVANGVWCLSAIVRGAIYDMDGKISFTVPKGVYGVLSFDWSAQCQGMNGLGGSAGIYVDETPAVSIVSLKMPSRGGGGYVYSPNSGEGTYVHSVPLGEGTHTIRGYNTHTQSGDSTPSNASIDNLKFELIGESPLEISAQSVKTEDVGGGFTRYTGSFETPNRVISYSPRPLNVYSGSIHGSPFLTGIKELYSTEHTYSPPLTGYDLSFNIPENIRVFEHNATNRQFQISGDFSFEYYVRYPIENYFVSWASSADAWRRNDEALTYTANETYAGTKATFSFAADTSKIKNFSLYYLENGVKTYVTRDSLESASEAAAWTTENAALAVVDERPTGEEKEKGALIYKKGQLVAYNIVYTDYENDPGKEEFWRYTHTPFNDGEHPDAGTIMSRTGETLKVADKVLPKSIDRFYIDGKYVVEHWQRDDTDRTLAGNGAVNYDDFNKLSNTESLTFYIEGGGEAPWVTSIKTNPDPVKEGDKYKIEVRVDDLEKDDLNVLVEVYREGKKVYEYCKEGLKADENGDYPPVITGFAPEAEAGDYTVVVTVWDDDGTGLGDHGFTVILEGRIKGVVRHTDQWDDNRKSYNTRLFKDAYNQVSAFDAYKAEKAPRKRGTNVFWSGERFMLEAAVGGNPTNVVCVIDGYPSYTVNMTNSGGKNADGDAIYTGSIWKEDMINKWGRNAPVTLKFVFTAFYGGDVTKTHEESVIVDMHEDYWRLHRYF
jgi:hypothetical protein